MRKKRRFAASVVINNKLWVAGGIDENWNQLISTEFIDPATGSVEYGPNLPKPSYAPCLVLINSTMATLIGGTPDPNNKMWMYNYDREDQGWVSGPDLNTGRHAHACGMVKDSADDSKTIVIAAGGYDGYGDSKSTEYFIVGGNQWRPGPNLEYRIEGASGVMTPDGKSLMFVGGWNDDKKDLEDAVYKLECWNLECTLWTEASKKLGVARNHFLAAFLPDSLLGCN